MSTTTAYATNTHTCPHCNQTLRVPDSYLGKVIRCGGCQKLLSVPDAPAALPPSAIPPLPPPPPPAEEEEAPKKLKRKKGGSHPAEGDWRLYEETEDENGHTVLVERRWACPYCDCEHKPYIERRWPKWGIWLLGAGFVFLPLLIIGLLIREDVAICPECKSQIGTMGNAGLL